MEFPRTLLDALKLVVLVVPQRPARRIGPGQLWLALGVAALVGAVESWLETPPPRLFDVGGVGPYAACALAVLLLGYLTAVALQRPALWWPLATLLVLTQLVVGLAVEHAIAPLLERTMSDASDARLVANALWFALGLLCVRRVFDYLEPHRAPTARGASAILVTLALVAPVAYVGKAEFFHTDFFADETPDDVAQAPPAFDPEAVMSDQAERLAGAIARLAPQRPGVPDLYVVAFGGDGSENVFRNEVEYVERLFAERFGALGRTLVLVNNPATVAERPLATLTNLERALRAVGARIDPAEDIVLVFLTTHGDENHELYVALDPLPLNQIRPADLAAAIADAGIRWRVVIVSACYAGGFVPALRSSDALVIAAAREDRSSFGCGVDSDITYFGRAFFAEALNETPSFTAAFARAARRIRAWEEADEETPSEPQIASAPAIETQLARWQSTLEPGPPVAFEPAAKTGAAQH
jgi:hypothetical protein